MILMRIKNVDPKGWYDIPGYDGLYQINYWGNVRKRLKYVCYKQLHPYVKKSRKGKRFIKLCGKEWVVMSLMRITFIGELPEGYVTYHKNGIKTDDVLKDRQEFIEATNKLKRELKRTWLCKIMIRLLDWLAEKI